MKARALTEMVYVDEIDVDQEGIAEMTLDENAIAQVPRKSAKGCAVGEGCVRISPYSLVSTCESALESRSGS